MLLVLAHFFTHVDFSLDELLNWAIGIYLHLVKAVVDLFSTWESTFMLMAATDQSSVCLAVG